MKRESSRHSGVRWKKRKLCVISKCTNTVRIITDGNVNIIDSKGQKKNVRLMLDSGSDATLISESCINYLGLKRKKNALYSVNG